MIRVFIGFLLVLPIIFNFGKIVLNPNQTLPLPTSAVYYPDIDAIPVPAGYTRITIEKDSFGEWLRKLKLKPDTRLRLYNGALKPNQSMHYAVLDISVGNKNLQQWADAILRLRAEYFFSRHKLNAIVFSGSDGTSLSFNKWLKGTRYSLNGNRLEVQHLTASSESQRMQLDRFLEVVFTYCGTYSLFNETMIVHDISDIQPGDVFVNPGSPGHAMIVADVALNNKGEKVFMLAQSFMPAQDIHIVKNPMNKDLSPWYKVQATDIITPAWKFYRNQLKRWK